MALGLFTKSGIFIRPWNAVFNSADDVSVIAETSDLLNNA